MGRAEQLDLGAGGRQVPDVRLDRRQVQDSVRQPDRQRAADGDRPERLRDHAEGQPDAGGHAERRGDAVRGDAGGAGRTDQRRGVQREQQGQQLREADGPGGRSADQPERRRHMDQSGRERHLGQPGGLHLEPAGGPDLGRAGGVKNLHLDGHGVDPERGRRGHGGEPGAD